MSKERFRIHTAVYLLLRRNDQILLARRRNTGYQDGNYGLVSGHLEEGESITQGLIREVQEEAGIKIRKNDLEFIQALHRKSDQEYICIFFESSKWKGRIKNMEPNKCDDLRWFPENSLPKNIVPELKLTLKNIKRNLLYDEQGF